MFDVKTCQSKLAEHYQKTAKVPTTAWSSVLQVDLEQIYTLSLHDALPISVITVHPHRTVSLSEFSFFKLAIAFADQNPPGPGTFDLSVGPF